MNPETLKFAIELIAGASLRELELTALDISLRTDLTRAERAKLTKAVVRRALALSGGTQDNPLTAEPAPVAPAGAAGELLTQEKI